MTKKSNIFALMVSLALLLSACSGDDFWETFDHTVDGTIDLNVGIESAMAQQTLTRTGESTDGYYAMKEGTQIRLKVDGYWKRNGGTISNKVTCSTNSGVSGINTVVFEDTQALYWDDYGVGDPANVDSNNKHYKEKGLKILGVSVNGLADAPAISDDTEWASLSWSLATDGNKVLDKDIIVSNNLTAYKFDERTIDAAKKMIFTHPLSKITFNITAGDGFASGFTNDPVLTLSDANGNGYAYVNGTINISNGTATASGTSTSVIAGTTSNSSDKKNYVKQALVYPDTKFGDSDDAVIAILNADDNIYYIKAKEIRKAMLDKGSTTDCPTQPGYNYVINITVKKVGISLTATVTNWEEITSTADAEIQFNPDVTTVGTNDTSLKDGDSFALWMAKDGDTFATDFTTTSTYRKSDNKFTNSTAIYWPNGTNKYNFRALAEQTSQHTLQAVTSNTIALDTDSKLPDLFWGTSGTGAIAPRTGDVPLKFSHAMSNVVVNLTTSQDADSKVELSGATVTMSKLYTDGKIDIASGVVSVPDNSNQSTVTVSDETIMVPQDIDSNAKLTITLYDGTTYSLLLNTINSITKWESGNKYTYKIYLEKEAMKFSVTIAPWVDVPGSGKATLDWD